MEKIESKQAAENFFLGNPTGGCLCVNAKGEEKQCASIDEANAHFDAGETTEETANAGGEKAE